MIRRQLPALSPLTPARLVSAAASALASPDDAHARLVGHLEQRFDSDRTWLVGSGTQALQAAIEWSCGRSGRAVALPAYSCYDVVTAAVGAGAPVEFYDIDPVSLAPDVEDVRRSLARGVGAVMANSLYGFPIDWTALREVCREADVVLIEDNAQGIGSEWRGEQGGTCGDLTVLSFGRGKGWTGGSGGALLARGPQVPAGGPLMPGGSGARGARSLVASLAQWALSRPSLFGIPAAIPALHVGETLYKRPGDVTAMDAIPAAVVLQHAELAEREIPVRARNAQRWRSLLESVGGIRPCEPVEGGAPSHLRFPVLCSEACVSRLSSPQGLAVGAASGYPRPLFELPQVQGLLTESRTFDGAAEISRSLWTLPTHSMVAGRDFRSLEALFSD